MADYSYDEFGVLRDTAVGYDANATNYDTPGEVARARTDAEVYAAARAAAMDPYEVDGMQTSSGYVRIGYYLEGATALAKYYSLPAVMQRQASRTYAGLTGGRDLATDATNAATEATEPLQRAANAAIDATVGAIKTATDAVAKALKTAAIVGACGLVAFAIFNAEKREG